ncbi:MAG: Cna B-type domain-containing protein [Oscillospiraceae bacterium]|nr:Cna B-type domain-containing protein [Oscillospiraceae bacterium]
MENNLEQRLQKYAKKHKRKKVWKKILSTLSLIVVFCTTYALILPAITQEREIFCNTEEHIHSEECSLMEEKILICELPEEEGHSHSEYCYSENLICTGEENHLHTEECYLEEELICEKAEEHIHSESCFEKAFICETEETEGHIHTEECYITEETSCIIEEHSHNLECYSDKNADIETEAEWTAAFIGTEKAEADSENIIRIAKSQLGYHESVKNYKVLDDGETVKGRTRFGEWFGEPYADWNILFAGFVIDYSEAEIPFDADIEKWIELLSLPENDFYKPALEHKPLPGDMVFINNDETEEPDFVGIVYEVTENTIKIIAGDIGDCVSAAEYEKTDERIIGYCVIAEPSPYLCEKEEHLHEEKCFDFDGNLVCGKDEHGHSDECLEKPEQEEEPEWLCGTDEHAHGEECYDENENLICEIPEHAHDENCLKEPSEITEEELLRIEKVISMIEELPTYEEIEEKIIEFEDAEDYEGEEIWLTGIYQQVGYAYKYYSELPEEHKQYVTNAEKLLDLEFIWSIAVLIDIEIGETVEYAANMFDSARYYVIYTESENGYYAINGNGSTVPINIDSEGIITAGINNKDEILWSFTKSGNDYTIRNKATNTRYLYPSGSAITGTRSNKSTLVESSGGVKIKYGTEYIKFNTEAATFEVTKTEGDAAVYKFGISSNAGDVYVWFDGTWGGIDMLSGSDNTCYTISKGSGIVLPTEWKSPDAYAYKVCGWYDVVGKQYYEAGTEIYPEKSTVFYPDWIPASYNIGQFNADASNTVSTSSFVTTYVFDYSPFYNLQYVTAEVTVNGTSHSEKWKLSDGNKFIFRNYSSSAIFTCPDNGQTSVNGYNQSSPTTGILNDELIEKLFGSTQIIGKTYLGTGDYLFQYCDDPANTEYYGYYYYDSSYHAASYNQSAQRFYVYDYLEATSDNTTADFLPLNSPYVNTNGQTVKTYTDNGQYGQYAGTTHYQYDSDNGVGPDFWFGIQTDIRFHLSGKPGSTDSEGNRVNQGINGDDLIFEFTGDDDVWVLVDGELVLDIGGIHQAVSGSINFATGEVIVAGKTQKDVKYLEPGDHVLTMYYLERGAGDSNCKVKFNISTRYGLSLQKEDVLTRELLNGAEFTVYTNESCTNKAMLWTSHADYEAGGATRSTFVVENGVAEMWGLAAGNTYYIKETKYPTNGGYGVANGIIVMKLNSKGQATFEVIPDPEGDGSDLSGGFTVHGYKIDVENHEAYLVATNSKEEYGDEVTAVTVMKKWNDSADHSKDSVTVYILANGVRIQETVLSEDNDWKHTWKNLPINGDSGKPVTYTVAEGTVPGYFGMISELTETTAEVVTLTQKDTPTSGETYLLKTSSGYLSASGGKFSWITSEETAKNSPSARWIIKKSGQNYTFENEEGQRIYHSNSLFNAGTSNATAFTFSKGLIGYKSGSRTYYPTEINDKGQLSRGTSSSSALVFTLYQYEVETQKIEFEGKGFLITNTPIEETEKVSLTVKKAWNLGNFGTVQTYEQLVIKIKLISNDEDSGMVKELSLKSGWSGTFSDLPKYDEWGKEIVYTVEEVWFSNDWRAEYGEIVAVGENNFETTVTNVYRLGYKLPETGGNGNQYNIIGGIFLMTAGLALIYKKIQQKRRKEDSS